MTNYLLSCECGKSVPVEVRQAGEHISCDCGAMLEVPPLRKLRHLPVAAPMAAETAGAWSPRLGIVTACLLLAAILAIIALWNRLTEPVVAPFDATARERFVEDGLKKMTPVQAWRSWIESYRPLAEHGFSVYQNPMTAAIEAEVARRRFLQKTLLVVAATLAAIAILAAFWPRASARRR
jgi:hypothetical protein